jgi:hypothetical protein
VLYHRKVVETLLDEEANDAVAVEDEICPASVVVAYHAGNCWFIAVYMVDGGPYVSNAISCGVCGRMWTFSCSRGVETVAVGFWVDGRYSGPTHCEGATGCESEDMLKYVMQESERLACLE